MSSLKRLFKKKVNGAGSGQDTDAQDEGEQYGLFTLHDGVNEAVVLDIVAVHGLGGHWRDTWMAENERLWLRDSIPIKMAAASTNARIFSYGYNANTAFSRAVTDITDEAAMLLDRIKSERKSTNERKRPLIFIAHSLGGILVKKVQRSYRSLHKSVAK
ncbi:hypothetical protein SLS56_006739 [Neofusicoccum ribis]|uniref:DUF676 domain-containing protein n=1 Tax=Neofusicoccum ribis TaxID=45134 RepID=A0ABR3SQR0_9PEZI